MDMPRFHTARGCLDFLPPKFRRRFLNTWIRNSFPVPKECPLPSLRRTWSGIWVMHLSLFCWRCRLEHSKCRPEHSKWELTIRREWYSRLCLILSCCDCVLQYYTDVLVKMSPFIHFCGYYCFSICRMDNDFYSFLLRLIPYEKWTRFISRAA